MGKLLIIASVVVTLITAGLGFANKGKLAESKTRAEAAEADAKTKSASLTKANGELTSAKKDLDAAKTDKAAADAQLATATTDLEKAKKEAGDALAAADTATKDKATLQTTYDDIKGKYDALVVQGTPTQGGGVSPELQDLKTQLEEAKTLIAKLQQDVNEKNSKITVLDAANVARNAHILKQGTEGRILAVNPAWNFVVLSLGDKQGVASNTELLVKRGNQLVGKIRVTSVEPSTSIADIVGNSVPRGTVIAPGDHVIYGGSAQE